MPFWDRVERRLQAALSDRAKVARAFQIASYVSTLMVVLGIVLALLIYTGVWTP